MWHFGVTSGTIPYPSSRSRNGYDNADYSMNWSQTINPPVHPIFDIVRRKNMNDLVNHLILNPIADRARDQHGKTVLSNAVNVGWTAGVRFLLNKRDVMQGYDKREDLPLIVAIMRENPTIVSLLIENIKRFRPSFSTKQAVYCIDIAYAMRAKAMKRQSHFAEIIAEKVSELFNLFDHKRMFRESITSGHTFAFSRLLMCNKDMDRQRMFYDMLLYGASPQACTIILDHGVDLSASFLSQGFMYRNLVDRGDLFTLKLLAERGATFGGMKMDGSNYLHVALTTPNDFYKSRLLGFLIQQGVNPNTKRSSDGLSALEFAFNTNQKAEFIVELLNEENMRIVDGDLNRIVTHTISTLITMRDLENLRRVPKRVIKCAHDITCEDWLGQTHMHDSQRMFTFLLSCGLDVNLCDSMNVSMRASFYYDSLVTWLALGSKPSDDVARRCVYHSGTHIQQMFVYGHGAVFDLIIPEQLRTVTSECLFALAKLLIVKRQINIFTDTHWVARFEDRLNFCPGLQELVDLANNLPMSLRHFCLQKIHFMTLQEENAKRIPKYIH